MTDRRPLLRAIFDAAVAAAHPDVVLAAHLRPVPKGRVICLAAGKAALSAEKLAEGFPRRLAYTVSLASSPDTAPRPKE